MAFGVNTAFKGVELATPYIADAYGNLKSKFGFGTTDLDITPIETNILGQYTTNTSQDNSLNP